MVRMKEIRKSTFREIKSSFGRFMAIFAIVALGVGFFAGLKVTKPAMVATVKEYLDTHAFYDFRLLSTMGFEAEDVEFLKSQEDVEAAEGAVSVDTVYRLEGGRQGVLKAHSLTDSINTVELSEGRMPLEDHECVVDSNLFDGSAIGSVLYLFGDDGEDSSDIFRHEAYTIVGTVQSSLYIQYERGNTSLGTGKVDGFVYLMREGFDTEVDTEVYVRFSQKNALYGEDYSNYIDEKELLWEEYTTATADRKYQSVLAEANEKLEEARQEFEDKKCEGEKELAEAALTLEDARAELTEGEQALEDVKVQLSDARKQLKEKKTELEEGRQTLAEKEQELADGETKLADAERLWSENKDKVNSGWSDLSSQRAQLQQQKSALNSQAAAVEQQAAGLDTQGAQLDEQEAQLRAAADMSLISSEELVAGLQQIEEARLQIQMGRQQIDGVRQEIQAGREQIAVYERQAAEAESELKNADDELAKGREQLDASQGELAEGRQAISDARQEIADGEKALADAESELYDAESTLREKEEELENAKIKLADGEREYAEASEEFEEKIGEGEAELADAEAEIRDIEAPQVYVLGRDTNIGYVCFENDSDIVEGIANIFPVFFFLVAALVCITTMNRMVEEQRTQIGVLKALGYGNGTIMSKYMIYSGLAAVLGCICGYALGTWGFPRIIWYVYGIMYKAGKIAYVFGWKLAAVSLGVALLCSVGTTWLSCRVELGSNAAQLMRPRAPKAGKRVFLEKIPFIWKRLSFLKKVSVRNIFRYKKRLFMMVLGISGCTALLVTGFGIKDSIANVAAQQFGEIQVYDMSITFRDPVDGTEAWMAEDVPEIGMKDALCVMEKSMDIVTDRGVKSVYLVAGDESRMPLYLDMHTRTGEKIPYPQEGEGVITRKLASEYGIKAGDTVTLRAEDMRSLTVRVTAVMENYIYNYVYISEETWRKSMGAEPERKTAYVNLEENADSHQMAAAFMKQDNVSNVTVNEDIMNRIGSMLDSLDIIVIVVILCAAGLAFIVLYNLSNINITERVREIATIKVLGFYKKETASYVFRENMMLTVMGMAFGLILGHFLHLVVMKQIRVDMIDFDVHVTFLSYLCSGILTLVFTWLVNKVMGRKLESISMTESLKSVD